LAAEHGLPALGRSVGVGVARSALREARWRESLARIEALIASRSGKAPRARTKKHTITTALRRPG
jgi:hypothetical protein